MAEIEANGLPMIEEEEASPDVARLYTEVKRGLQTPVVPNFMKALAVSPAALHIFWAQQRAFLEHSTLPQSLTAMILYAIAHQNECEYCSAAHELTCRTLGIDEETLRLVIADLPQLSPERIRKTLEFALRVARAAKTLEREDFDTLRTEGLSDEEIVEIIYLAAMGSSGDVLADALKVSVDDAVAQALGRK